MPLTLKELTRRLRKRRATRDKRTAVEPPPPDWYVKKRNASLPRLAEMRAEMREARKAAKKAAHDETRTER